MFVPPFYREPSGLWMAELVRDNPLALAVTNGSHEEGPFATHLPVILDPQLTGEWPDDLVGVTLFGHLNRMNPHWKALKGGDMILLSFTGPHAYVSPAVYQMTPAAPTWNFTAVHVRGRVEPISSTEDVLGVVRATALALEGAFGSGWDQTESLDYFRQIVSGVGAFRVTVTSAKGMFKLSQEQPAEVRERVQDSFSKSPCTRHRETADLMRLLPDTTAL